MAEDSGASTAAEPSMEEILASIRKIIADEKPPAASETPVDDVLELTQMVEMDGSVKSLPTPAPEEKPEPAPEAVVIESSVEPEPPSPEPPPEASIPPAVEAPIKDPVMALSFDAPVEASVVSAVSSPEALVSERTIGAASSALAALTNTLNSERLAANIGGFTPLGNGARTLEDMVLELMRPMLSQWLEQNLPATVERLVQKEVERIVQRVGE